MDPKTKKRQRITSGVLMGLAIAGAISAAAVFYLYYHHFGHMEISKVPANWGPFGDFIGGVLNPIIGLFALVGLLWTIYQNQVELSLAREEMGRSSEALEKSNEQSEKRSQIENTLRAIEVIDQQIVRMLDDGVMWDDGVHSFGSYLFDNRHSLDKDEMNEGFIIRITLELKQLILNLRKHKELSGDNSIYRYYTLRILPIAKKIRLYDSMTEALIDDQLPDYFPSKMVFPDH
ncbi:MAG: hypothetical protein RPU51_09205 [Candidatus Sedimenticola sp. (ex Thyasira tokunagai)]